MAQVIWDVDMEADSLETWTLHDSNPSKKSDNNLTLLNLEFGEESTPLGKVEVVQVVEQDSKSVLNRDNDTDPLFWSSEVTEKVESLLESVEAELAYQRNVVLVQTEAENSEISTEECLDTSKEQTANLLVDFQSVPIVFKGNVSSISSSSGEWLVDSLNDSHPEPIPIYEINYVQHSADVLLFDEEPHKLCNEALTEPIRVMEQAPDSNDRLEKEESYEIVHHETASTVHVQVYAVCPHKAELEQEELRRLKKSQIPKEHELHIQEAQVLAQEEDAWTQNGFQDEEEAQLQVQVDSQQLLKQNQIEFEEVVESVAMEHELETKACTPVAIPAKEDQLYSNNVEDSEQQLFSNNEIEDNEEQLFSSHEIEDENQLLHEKEVDEHKTDNVDTEQEQFAVESICDFEASEQISTRNEFEFEETNVTKVKSELSFEKEQLRSKIKLELEKEIGLTKEFQFEGKQLMQGNGPKNMVEAQVANKTNHNACPSDNSMHVIFGVALRSAPKPMDYDAMDIAKENEKPLAVNLAEAEILNAAENVQKKKKKKKVDGEKKKKTKKSSETSSDPEEEEVFSSPPSPTKLTRSRSHHEMHGNQLFLPVTQIELVDLHGSNSSSKSPNQHFEDNSVPSMPSVKNLKQTYYQVVAAASPHARANSELRTRVDIEHLKASWNDLSLQEPPTKHTLKEKICTGVSVADLRRSFSDLTNMEHSRVWTPNPKLSSKSLRGSFEDLSMDFSPMRKATSTPKLNKQISEYEEKTSFTRERVEIDYNKKIYVRSVDTAQVQRQFNKNVFPLYAALDQHEKAGDGETTKLCRLCQKQVFQMELIKAEKSSWHKNCFRCKECSKQLTVDTYMSHEGVLFCKPHFKSLFQPKAVFDEEQPVRIRKLELIVRENQPLELDPDVVRSSDRPDYGLEELSNLDVKSRFSVFEKSKEEDSLDRDLSRSPSMAGVKRAESILVKMAKFQAGKGLEGLTADELNGMAHAEEEENSSSDEEEVEGVVKSRKRKERAESFASMGDLKHKWEKSAPTEGHARREVLAEERKDELQKLRARLCAGRQERLKEAYEQAVQDSEVTPKSGKLDLEVEAMTVTAKSLKERFEKGMDEDNRKSKLVEDESDIFEAGTAKQSRHLFKEMEAQNAGKQETTGLRRTQSQRIPQTPEEPKKFVREVSGELVRSSDTSEQVEVPTADLASRFRFFETYKEEKEKEKAVQPRKKIVIPRQQPEQDTTDGQIARDPNVARGDDKVEEEVKTNTASRMLSVFRQMELGVNEEKPQGPKPLKSFTPPPDYKGETDSEEEEEEDDEEEEGSEFEEEEEEGVYHQNEDELLRLAKDRAVAKNLRAKFEKWEVQMEQRENRVNALTSEEIQASLDTAKNLKARFESMKTEATSPEKPKAKVNRFVESCAETCNTCGKRVYAMEKLEAASKIFHKSCFKCSKCSCVLRLETFTQNKGRLYCTPHFKQLFIVKGNYDEGFGDEQLCKKWMSEKNKNGVQAETLNHTNGCSKSPEDDEWDVLEQELLEE